MTNIFFTSDNHFGHANIIEYCERPFIDVNDMNETMIRRWNAFVRSCDIVYHLGDFSLGPQNYALEIMSRLNGNKFIIKGNHDRWTKKKFDLSKYNIVKIVDYHELKLDGKKIVLSHYPFARWNRCHRGSYMLHGHEHGSYDGSWPGAGKKLSSRIMDVGVDCWAFAPASYDEVDSILSKLPETKHHGVLR